MTRPWPFSLFGLLATLACLAPAAGLAAPQPIRTTEAGIELSVRSLDWHLDGPFAMRSLELVVRNPHDRPLETTVLLPLAPHERLQGYALDVEGRLRDAVAVERVAARVAFEETVRQQVDPALAEKDAGNAYRIRVFPVPPRGERRLRVDVASLAERAACGWRHQLEPGLPAGTAIKAVMTLQGRQTPREWRMGAGRPVPEVCLRAPRGDVAYAASFDDGLQMHWLEVPTLTFPAATAQRPQPAAVEIVWDASYSQLGVDRSRELELLSLWLEGRTVNVVLTVLRNDVRSQRLQVRNRADAQALLTALRDERPDGATHLGAWRPDPGVNEVLLFSDAVNTWPGTLAPVDKPVFVLGTRLGNPALARWLGRAGGQVLDLSATSPQAALAQMQQVPQAQARLGPRDASWHLASHTPERGALRACHVAPQPAAVPSLPLTHAASAPAVQRHQARPGTASGHAAGQASFWCATWWAEGLEAQAEQHRATLASIGERFGIPNAETSLLVLESDEDYVRHGILPSQADASLRERVLRHRQLAEARKAQAWARNRADIEHGWQERQTWWRNSYPKGDFTPATEKERRRVEASGNAQRMAVASVSVPAPTPAPAPAAGVPSAANPSVVSAIGLRLQAVRMDAPYVETLRTAQDAAQLYERHADLRNRYGQSPAFHFDVADRLFELGDTALGWRVLSNLVELLPRDQATLRLVAYRLQEAGLPVPAVALLRRVKTLAPDEPQSFRDLALALGAPPTCQEALDLLAHVVDTPWLRRFADVGLIALAEYHDQASRCPGARPTSWPDALQTTLPVGLRVVLRWDLNDTDIDLHVTDPNRETAFYGHRRTHQGGHMSKDFVAGYGPEEFILKDPKPGDYQVAVNYFGSRLARLSRGVVINITLQTGFGTPAMQQRTLSMRLLENTGTVTIGGFTVRPDGELLAEEKP
ncbi:VIT domain-containing protein [Hydrogenophaga palleronii]|uniref:VIT domain-containing protein n=1 Tax=Hydrogenophaga palleronii TaxID=65655 RepID=UPI00082617D7|nr:VIT domain-containing protein [Hydrogenophaga palleronii]